MRGKKTKQKRNERVGTWEVGRGEEKGNKGERKKERKKEERRKGKRKR